MKTFRALRLLALGFAAILPALHPGASVAQSPILPTPTC